VKKNKENSCGDLLVNSYLISAEEYEQIEIYINSTCITEEDIEEYL